MTEATHSPSGRSAGGPCASTDSAKGAPGASGAVLTLDENHVYRLGDRVIPGTTSALSVVNDLSFIDPVRLEAARDFGTHVHLMTDLFDKGELDEDALDLALVPYLAAYKQFLFDTKFVVTHSEQKVYHRGIGYAGTLDKRGYFERATALLDIKSGAFCPGYVGPQTAAYKEAVRSEGDGQAPQRRACLQLMRNVYRLHTLNDPADWPMFISCLNVYRNPNYRRKSTHVSPRHFTE